MCGGWVLVYVVRGGLCFGMCSGWVSVCAVCGGWWLSWIGGCDVGVVACGWQGFQNQTGPGGRTVKTENRDENRFSKHKEPNFLLIP